MLTDTWLALRGRGCPAQLMCVLRQKEAKRSKKKELPPMAATPFVLFTMLHTWG